MAPVRLVMPSGRGALSFRCDRAPENALSSWPTTIARSRKSEQQKPSNVQHQNELCSAARKDNSLGKVAPPVAPSLSPAMIASV